MDNKTGLKIVDPKKMAETESTNNNLSDNDRIKRGLRAILSADVQGYSRLMNQNEAATIRTLKSCRSLIERNIREYHGRVVDTPGDNILTEFPSVVDAVEASVSIQEELKIRNANQPEEQQMMFRIGINLGDVIVDEDRIYGDGVNIAARLEGLAEGGGICISGTVYDQVKNKLDLEYDYLGEQSVKNISEPVRVYRINLGAAIGSRSKALKEVRPFKYRMVPIILGAFILVAGIVFLIWKFQSFLPSENIQETKGPPPSPVIESSIAVLPFTNNSGDSGQNYFIDGITENIITVLSKTPGLLVISRESSFSYRDRPMDVEEIGKELGVLYLLKGSMQKSEELVRISVQLINASNGELLWAERYDRTLQDIFTLQDEITMKIINALNIHLSHGEQLQIMTRGTENLDAYLKLLQGMELMRSGNPADLDKIMTFAEEAISLDPEYAKGYVLLAMAQMRTARAKGPPNPEIQERAIQTLRKALELDPSDPMAYEILGNIYYQRREFDKAIIELEKVVAINPNSTEGLSALARIRLLEEKPLEAISLFEEARKRDPLVRNISIGQLGQAYFMAGKYKEAISIYKQITTDRRTDDIFARTNLIACYTALGEKDEAARHVSEILRFDPEFSLEEFLKTVPYRDPKTKKNYTELLQKAGL